MYPFSTPWKHQKTFDFTLFLRYVKWEHRPEMSWNKELKVNMLHALSQIFYHSQSMIKASLNHLFPMLPFSTPWKHQNTSEKGFLMFSWGRERVHWEQRVNQTVFVYPISGQCSFLSSLKTWDNKNVKKENWPEIAFHLSCVFPETGKCQRLGKHFNSSMTEAVII